MKKTTLRIGSYNIANGGYVDHDFAPIAKDILSADLDIVGLQEVDMGTGRAKKLDTMKILSEMTGYRHYRFFKTIDFWGGEYGLAVLSKYPITSSEKYLLPSGIHEQRALGEAVIDVDGRSISFFVTHLSFGVETKLRMSQYERINSVLSTRENFILTGDFNCDSLDEINAIENASAVNTESHSILTCHGACIDNIVYSQGWTFGTAEVIDNGNSDHGMLYAEGVLTE